MIPEQDKRIIIIAGPNGAGKTTFAKIVLPKLMDSPTFINADLIAAGLSPFNPHLAAIKAGKLMLREIHEHVSKGLSFTFETTLSGIGYSRMIPQWRSSGYRVILYYLSLPTVEMAIARVAARVTQGGHDIPEEVIRRRFEAGLKNFFEIYKQIVDEWYLLDNTNDVPCLIAEGSNEKH